MLMKQIIVGETDISDVVENRQVGWVSHRTHVVLHEAGFAGEWKLEESSVVLTSYLTLAS
ncbi:MAG: hypothetical protein KIH01_06045 [Candidatus Freyarchaeota archaeon]|nr:hypothetical protein [Candidatus Jordarchaeia archaeon]